MHIWKSYVCSNQLDVQETDFCLTHFQQESGIISLDTGPPNGWTSRSRYVGTSLVECCVPSSNQSKRSKENAQETCRMTYHHENKPRTKVHTPNQYNDLELCNVYFVSSNVKSSQSGAMLYIFEDSDAVIKMIINGRSPTIRHVSRTCRVALDWLFDRINLDSKILIKYVDTKKTNRRQTDKGQFHT